VIAPCASDAGMNVEYSLLNPPSFVSIGENSTLNLSLNIDISKLALSLFGDLSIYEYEGAILASAG